MGLFQPLKPKKGSLFDKRNQELDDIYNYQNPNTNAEKEFPNLRGNQKKEKKRGLFG